MDAEENKENCKTMTSPRNETEESLKRLSSEILVTPKSEMLIKSEDKLKFFSPKITPNGDKVNIFNHSSFFNMSLSPVVLNGAVTITPKADPGAIFNGGAPQSKSEEKPWFSLLVRRSESGNSSPKSDNDVDEDEFHPGKSSIKEEMENNIQIDVLEQKLKFVRKMNKECPRKQIPSSQCRGWWKISEEDEQILGELEANLLQKGTREQGLHANIRKGFDAVAESTRNVVPEEIDLLDEDYNEENKDEHSLPAPEDGESWSRVVAIRVDKHILDQVEALEDKVASASMQVPVRQAFLPKFKENWLSTAS